jgi:galacturan 1,4-alpha-galacturonidase
MCRYSPVLSSSGWASSTTDDKPQILDSFKQCRNDSSIVFTEGTYNIGQVMDELDLSNCDISIYGTFRESKRPAYLPYHSMDPGAPYILCPFTPITPFSSRNMT